MKSRTLAGVAAVGVLAIVVAVTSPKQTREVKETSFERTAALRRGLLSGLSARMS